MKGLKPNIARYIGMMENSNIKELKTNIKKQENLEFLITGQTFQSPSEIKDSIFKEQINQLSTQLNKKIENSKNQSQNINKFNNYKNPNYKGKNNNNLPLYYHLVNQIIYNPQ